MTDKQVIKALLRRKGASSLSALAREMGVPQSFLWRVTHGLAKPSPKIFKFLKLKQVKTVKYVKTR
jgi:lambda repressor-like predicted transcriptional regulator